MICCRESNPHTLQTRVTIPFRMTIWRLVLAKPWRFDFRFGRCRFFPFPCFDLSNKNNDNILSLSPLDFSSWFFVSLSFHFRMKKTKFSRRMHGWIWYVNERHSINNSSNRQYKRQKNSLQQTQYQWNGFPLEIVIIIVMGFLVFRRWIAYFYQFRHYHERVNGFSLVFAFAPIFFSRSHVCNPYFFHSMEHFSCMKREWVSSSNFQSNAVN